MNPQAKRGIWTGLLVGLVCMFLADVITMIPAVQNASALPLIAVRWIIFAALVLIATIILRNRIRN